MMEKLDSTSLDLTKLNIEKLKELFPNAVTEGKIDFDILRTILGDEIEDRKEKYQFTWPGKSDAIKLAQTPSSATLRPDKTSSKNWDKTENLYIEGDNLEVLKQLQKTYYGKIKMIYIDPPYNTGNDFVYKDNFTDSIENYKQQTNQTSSSNPETNGRYHTDWLNMMYPRLILSKNLLSQNGAIFVSIDDYENTNLRKLCDEIFGENNFIACVVWQRNYAPISLKKYFSESHEYCYVYAKDKSHFEMNLLPRSEKQNKDYKNPDNDPRGVWKVGNLTVGPAVEKQIYEIIGPTGKSFYPPKGYCWRFTKEKFEQMRKEGRIWFGSDGNNSPVPKLYLTEVQDGVTPMTLWTFEEAGHNQIATRELRDIFNDAVFTSPKPIKYITRYLQIGMNKDDIILDFFSGSSTTADAVMRLNAEDNGRRSFIMVQLPELNEEKSNAFKAGYKNICEIGKERIRRAGESIKRKWIADSQGEGLFSERKEFPYDIGFKVFKLDSTNIQPWDNKAKLEEQSLFDLSDVFKTDRTKEDILYEIMLKYGVFDRSATEIEINGKIMYRVGKRYMIVCLDDNITSKDVEAIIALKPGTVIFKEAGFANDNDKINAVYNFKKAGINDIKCI